MPSGSRNYADERETGEIGVGKFRHIPMATADSQQCRAVQGNPGYFKRYTIFIVNEVMGDEVELLFHDTVHRFPAADMLVLVTATHVGQAALRERFECHRCRIVVTGKKIPALVGEALPALQPERLGAELHGSAMDKQHPFLGPFHRHCIE